jgi:hypothetical protein
MAEHVERAIKYNKLAAQHITATQSFRGRAYSSVTLENNEFGLVDINNPHANLMVATDIRGRSRQTAHPGRGCQRGSAGTGATGVP